ncbi:MAG: lytic transglycosylase domain-containing protein [Clostridia bacterium]|nr:lytic transglycosylase domain-containing protein [Clostridia bacterium]
MNFLKKIILIFFIFIILFFILIKYLEIDKIVLEKLYPRKFSNYVEEASQKYDVEESLIFAIIKNESNFIDSISSRKGAKGLMQLMEATAFEVAETMGISNIDLSNPKTNIEIGTKYYSYLYNKYKNYRLALAAYNAGAGNVDKWISSGTLESDGSNIENIPYKETNMYVRKVLQSQKIYNYIYYK